MANIAYRRKRKNNTGSYDTVYYETDSRIVIRPNGESVEDSLKKNVYVRPNLLDNWYFVGGGSQLGDNTFPINQRGETEYISSNLFDRWIGTGNSSQRFNLNTTGLNLYSSERYGAYLIQRLPKNVVNDLKGKYVTISALANNVAEDSNGSWSAMLYANKEWLSGTPAFTKDSLLVHKTMLIPEDTTELYFQLGANSSGNTEIIATKLEVGDTQTLAYQDDNGKWQLYETPDYASELLKCQTYFRRFPANWSLGGTQEKSKAVIFEYGLNPPMRNIPTVTLEDASDLTGAIDNGQNSVTPTEFILRTINKQCVEFYFMVDDLSITTFYLLRYVDVSAEL